MYDAHLKSRHKTFFTTGTGYFGTAAFTVRPGDSIALFSGLPTPFVVRKEGKFYRLLSAAYVHGIMDGELWNPDNIREFCLA
jgi:hypothetical protein